ncbi:MAG: hypothetical protein J0L69_09910 [Bacteroidetes bacterium]|nr:hypothetical protein [Bacteroidota bacterium]
MLPTFEECKKILNQGEEQYTDEQIKQIISLMTMWAKINARTIINHINKIKNEKSGDNGKGVF